MQIKINESIIDSVVLGKRVVTLEKRSDNLYVVRDGDKTLELSANEEAARVKFSKYKNLNAKGGENNNMGGYEKAKQTADKLKAEKTETEEKEMEVAAQAKSEIEALQGNSALAAMYNDAAEVGTANIGGQSLPILRIHAAGKSTNNELQNGSEPGDGSFYYKPTKEDLGKEIDVHILTISRGFYTKAMEGSEKDRTFNQLIGGIIGNDKPFVMYFSGTKLQDLWNFGKEASQYTRRKPVAFPMFSLKVRLGTKKGEKGKYAAPWIIGFEILRNEDSTPQLILDEGEFQYLKENVAVMEETIANVIEATELKSTVKAEEVITGEVAEEPAPDDISFN